MRTTDLTALVVEALSQQLAYNSTTHGETHSVVVDDILDDRTVRATLWDETGDEPTEVAVITLAVTSVVKPGDPA